MPQSTPELVAETLATLIAGRKIRGELPSFTELAAAIGASRSTIDAAVRILRSRGYVQKLENGRFEVTTPDHLQQRPLLDLIDALESAAVSTNVTFDELTDLLASRMLIHGDWADDLPGKLTLIRTAIETYRGRERHAPAKSSNRPLSRSELTGAARDDLHSIHGD